MRRLLIAATLLASATLATYAQTKATKTAAAPASKSFTVVEATIADMRTAMEQGRVTSRQLVQQYLMRIGTYEDRLHAAITVNPDALKLADERDRERAQGKVRGPLHGIPIALKDNIHTTDMRTTGGALAFEQLVPPYEATLTKNLRDAGAIIIAKTGMTELANWVAGAPTPMPGNYNAVGGQGYNPYDPRKDPRDATFDGRPALGTGGSSSGVGTAANFWAGNVGTETSGSVLSPSNQNMLAGIKPTVGRISRYGVIPITADQDTAGPMAKSVTDVAIMLGVARERRARSERSRDADLHAAARARLHEVSQSRRLERRAHRHPARLLLRPHRAARRRESPRRAERRAAKGDGRSDRRPETAGAVIVDPANIPSVVDKDPKNNFMLWNTCGGANNGRGKDENCSIDFKYGMKRDFNKWLASLGPAAPLKSLTELIAWNTAHQKAGSIKYGQSNLDVSDEMDLEKDRARYEADRAKDVRLGGTHGMDEIMKAERLDAILFPAASGAAIAAKPGYPTVIVPFGIVPNAPGTGAGRGGAPAGGPNNAPFPSGFDAKPEPYGVSFSGMACSEPKLIELAYSFEQATKKRIPPPLFP